MALKTLTLSEYVETKTFPITVTVMAGKPNQYSISEHVHDFTELVIIAKGTLFHHCGDETVQLRAGDFFLLHPGTQHAYSVIAKGTKMYNLLYDASVPIPMLMFSGFPFIECVYPFPAPTLENAYTGIVARLPRKELEELLPELESIRREERIRKPGHSIRTCALFQSVILLLARHYKAQRVSDANWLLNKAVAYLKLHLGEHITTAQIGRFVGMSESSLLRAFKSAFGIGPAEYIVDLRVRYAVQLLRNTKLTVEDIAEQSGFADSSHLWKTLQHKLNVSPKNIRQGVVS